MRVLNSKDLARVLPHADCIAALEPAMRAVSAGDTVLPLRQYMNIPDTAGKFTVMPGYLGDPRTFGVKLVSKYPREPGSPLGSHVGAVMIFDAEIGTPYAMIDGAELTAIRTAAASALATRCLSREDSHVLSILGAGTQAQHHVAALSAVRDIREIRIWSRTAANGQRLVDSLEAMGGVRAETRANVADAIASADIVCTTTSSPEPILLGETLEPGMHVNLVGAAVISSAEADAEVVRRSRFYIDYWESARAQAGELAAAIESGVVTEGHVIGELGDLLRGEIPGRQTDMDITTYKSLGVAAQDLAAAHAAYTNAERLGVGQVIDWP